MNFKNIPQIQFCEMTPLFNRVQCCTIICFLMLCPFAYCSDATPATLSEADLNIPLWAELADKPNAIDYRLQILPILKEQCFGCHGDQKQKGDLRLDTPQWLLTGIEGDPVMVPGNPEDSLLYELVIMLEDDIDVMPAKGDLLTLAETDLIKQWIANGAGFSGYRAQVMSKKPSLLDHIQGLLPPLTKQQKTFIKQHLGEVNYVSLEHDRLLSLSLPKRVTSAPNKLKNFASIRNNVVSLNLAGRTLTPAEREILPSFKHLTQLNLKQSNVTNKDLVKIGHLAHLRSLNLVQTNITDDGILSLKDLKGELFLWQSKVTALNPADLYQKITGLKIDLGAQNVTHQTTLEIVETRKLTDKVPAKKKIQQVN